MKTISADYNAMTEAGHVWLTTSVLPGRHSQAGSPPRRLGLAQRYRSHRRAQLAIDDRYGLVGVPDWDTLVHLDDEGADDFDRVKAELNPLLTKEPRSSEDEPRILELLTQLEHAAPPHFSDASPETLAFRRALALRQMGKLGLALLEIRRLDEPGLMTQMFVFVYLDLLRLEDLPSAVLEARIHRRIAGCGRPCLVGVHQHPRDAGGTSVRRTVRLDRPASPRLVSSVRSGPRSRSSGAVARGLVLLQSRTCAPSSGPNLSGSTGIRTRPTTLSRRPDA